MDPWNLSEGFGAGPLSYPRWVTAAEEGDSLYVTLVCFLPSSVEIHYRAWLQAPGLSGHWGRGTWTTSQQSIVPGNATCEAQRTHAMHVSEGRRSAPIPWAMQPPLPQVMTAALIAEMRACGALAPLQVAAEVLRELVAESRNKDAAFEVDGGVINCLALVVVRVQVQGVQVEGL